jgi:nicotinamide-nucleotide amidase
MKIEIVTTGNEVMQGVIVDTNTSWIAERAARLGHEIVRHIAVGDDLADIGDVLVAAAKRAEAVIVTGGLGPTVDDLTIEAAAKAFGVELVRDERVLAEIKRFFERVGRSMSKSNEKQALIPEGGEVLPNKVGTAPGISVRLGEAQFFFLPGVPQELYQIFDDSVEPWLAKKAQGAVCERVLRCFGDPEASIDTMLEGVDLGGVYLGFRVKFPEILLKLSVRAATDKKAQALVDAAAEIVRGRLGELVYGQGEDTLAQVVGRMLAEKGMILAVAESCTGGMVADLITDVPGASEYFDRGVVAYSNRSKEEILGVSEDILKAHGAVSSQTAIAMAEGIRENSQATIGIGITGIAGPGGGTPEKPVGTVHIAVATPEGSDVHEYHFQRHRLWFKQIAAATALDLVRRYLLRL